MRNPTRANSYLSPTRAAVYRTWADYQGLDVFINNGTLALYWYTFNDNGVSQWFMANCHVDAPYFDIVKTERGKGKIEEDPIGRGSLDLDSMVFHYNTELHGRGSWELQASIPNEYGVIKHSGVYYDPTNPGSGFSVKAYPGNLMSCYWYLESGQWLLCSGFADNLTIYQYLGGKFAYKGGEEHPCGTAAFDLDKLAFSYDVDAVGFKGNGKIKGLAGLM